MGTIPPSWKHNVRNWWKADLPFLNEKQLIPFPEQKVLLGIRIMSSRAPAMIVALLMLGGGTALWYDQGKMSTRMVEEAADAARGHVQSGTPVCEAFAYLKHEGFADESSSLGTALGDAPTVLFRKQIVIKRWWGSAAAHQVLVTFRVDTNEKVANPNAYIAWGGLRGL